MSDLSTRLRATVDAVDPVTLDEVLANAGTGRSPNPRSGRRLVAIAAAVLAIVVLGTGLALVARRGDHDSLRTTSSTTTTSSTASTLPDDPATCPLIDGRHSCVVTPDQARELLGFVVPRPSRLPEGWVDDLFTVDVYPPGTPDNYTSEPELRSRQIWKPEGTDRTHDLAAWAVLQVERVRPTDTPMGIDPLFTLDDGTEVRGDSIAATIGVHPRADPVPLTNLFWTRDGLWYWLFTHVLTVEQAADLVRSIR